MPPQTLSTKPHWSRGCLQGTVLRLWSRMGPCFAKEVVTQCPTGAAAASKVSSCAHPCFWVLSGHGAAPRWCCSSRSWVG